MDGLEAIRLLLLHQLQTDCLVFTPATSVNIKVKNH